MKQLFFYLSIFLAITSCKKSGNQPSALSADAQITQKINQLYTTYGKSNDALYNKEIPTDLFAPDLNTALEEAITASKDDIEKVKKSAHPDDKPLIFEGSLFCSLYEGYTSYKITSIETMESTKPLGSAADVTIEFENAKFSPKIIWKDKIHLINAFENGWRIDNIFFDKKIGNSADLKTNLNTFSAFAKK